MNAALICPGPLPALEALTGTRPVSNIPILGKSLLEYWLEHVVTQGARSVEIVATDRPECVRQLVGDGARWGLHVVIRTGSNELRTEEPTVIDHLPSQGEVQMLTGYADWFAAILTWLPWSATRDRIGVREIEPGVWIGLHSHLAANIRFFPPCWVGENAYIDSGAVLGPQTVVENEVFVGRGAQISESIIGPQTLVGEATEVRRSIAWGSTLVNWELDSWLTVPDEFLLCSLAPYRAPSAPAGIAARLAALATHWPGARFAEHFGHLLGSALAQGRRPH